MKQIEYEKHGTYNGMVPPILNVPECQGYSLCCVHRLHETNTV